MNLTLLAKDYQLCYDIGADYTNNFNTSLGTEYYYSMSPNINYLGSDSGTTSNKTIDKSKINWGHVLTTLSSEAQEWVKLIAEKGLPYYEIYLKQSDLKQRSSLEEAYRYLERIGAIRKQEKDYIPYVVSGIGILAVAGIIILLAKKRR